MWPVTVGVHPWKVGHSLRTRAGLQNRLWGLWARSPGLLSCPVGCAQQLPPPLTPPHSSPPPPLKGRGLGRLQGEQ